MCGKAYQLYQFSYIHIISVSYRLEVVQIMKVYYMYNIFVGLDWGGLRREWFESVCTQLFDPSISGLYRRFSDDSQGLVSRNTGIYFYISLHRHFIHLHK
jgi:hypothetical protein